MPDNNTPEVTFSSLLSQANGRIIVAKWKDGSVDRSAVISSGRSFDLLIKDNPDVTITFSFTD